MTAWLLWEEEDDRYDHDPEDGPHEPDNDHPSLTAAERNPSLISA